MFWLQYILVMMYKTYIQHDICINCLPLQRKLLGFLPSQILIMFETCQRWCSRPHDEYLSSKEYYRNNHVQGLYRDLLLFFIRPHDVDFIKENCTQSLVNGIWTCPLFVIGITFFHFGISLAKSRPGIYHI